MNSPLSLSFTDARPRCWHITATPYSKRPGPDPWWSAAHCCCGQLPHTATLQSHLTGDDPQGEFVLEMGKVAYDRHGKIVQGSDAFLGEFRTRSKAAFVARVEQFMQDPTA